MFNKRRGESRVDVVCDHLMLVLAGVVMEDGSLALKGGKMRDLRLNKVADRWPCKW